ncbi:YciI family protein [Psychroserpens mesophilus]|uniref:YciI family protein n=1 Tax=Psychroserpens mesophilus TaxID=325473 RepID=UPI003D654447
MKQFILPIFLFLFIWSCKDNAQTSDKPLKDIITEEVDNTEVEIEIEQSIKALKKELTEQGFQTFNYIDEKTQDTILMQQYFIAFLKRGTIRNQNEEEANRLQNEHLAHLSKMYELGYADISGPFGDDGDIRGITIYNVPTLKMADSLANADPMVKAGRLQIEIHPWWAAKGVSLR